MVGAGKEWLNTFPQQECRGVYPTVGKETYFLITISPIGAQIFEAASESNVTFVC